MEWRARGYGEVESESMARRKTRREGKEEEEGRKEGKEKKSEGRGTEHTNQKPKGSQGGGLAGWIHKGRGTQIPTVCEWDVVYVWRGHRRMREREEDHAKHRSSGSS